MASRLLLTQRVAYCAKPRLNEAKVLAFSPHVGLHDAMLKQYELVGGMHYVVGVGETFWGMSCVI